jgi:hypothetical protein
MRAQPQNLSREMTLYPMRCVSYLIGVYLTGTAHPANSIRDTSDKRRATNICKTNPISEKPKSTQPSSPQRVTTMKPPSAFTKTNPKRTQPVVSLSNLSMVSLSNLFVAAQPSCPGEVLYQAALAKPDQTQFQKQTNPAAFAGQLPPLIVALEPDITKMRYCMLKKHAHFGIDYQQRTPTAKSICETSKMQKKSSSRSPRTCRARRRRRRLTRLISRASRGRLCLYHRRRFCLLLSLSQD